MWFHIVELQGQSCFVCFVFLLIISPNSGESGYQRVSAFILPNPRLSAFIRVLVFFFTSMRSVVGFNSWGLAGLVPSHPEPSLVPEPQYWSAQSPANGVRILANSSTFFAGSALLSAHKKRPHRRNPFRHGAAYSVSPFTQWTACTRWTREHATPVVCVLAGPCAKVLNTARLESGCN
jgi:hypothetical protein